MHGRGLRQAVFDHGIEALAAPRDQDRLRHLLRPEIGNISAAPGDRVGALDDEPAHIGHRYVRWRASASHAGRCAGGAKRSQSGGKKAPPVHSTSMFSMRQMLGRRPPAYKAAIATIAACAALICERADAECTLIDDMREYATADAQRDDERRLALASAELAKELERRGMAPATGDAMRCWIQKVSNLILNINVEVR